MHDVTVRLLSQQQNAAYPHAPNAPYTPIRQPSRVPQPPPFASPPAAAQVPQFASPPGVPGEPAYVPIHPHRPAFWDPIHGIFRQYWCVHEYSSTGV